MLRALLFRSVTPPSFGLPQLSRRHNCRGRLGLPSWNNARAGAALPGQHGRRGLTAQLAHRYGYRRRSGHRLGNLLLLGRDHHFRFGLDRQHHHLVPVVLALVRRQRPLGLEDGVAHGTAVRDLVVAVLGQLVALHRVHRAELPVALGAGVELFGLAAGTCQEREKERLLEFYLNFL